MRNSVLSQPIPQLGAYCLCSLRVLFACRILTTVPLDFRDIPVSVGITQPLFAYNWMKWTRMTEPLVYEEAQKYFIENIEEISYNATSLFFRYLRIQTDFSLAESNLKNSRDNLKIAEVKQESGKYFGK